MESIDKSLKSHLPYHRSSLFSSLPFWMTLLPYYDYSHKCALLMRRLNACTRGMWVDNEVTTTNCQECHWSHLLKANNQKVTLSFSTSNVKSATKRYDKDVVTEKRQQTADKIMISRTACFFDITININNLSDENEYQALINFLTCWKSY